MSGKQPDDAAQSKRFLEVASAVTSADSGDACFDDAMTRVLAHKPQSETPKNKRKKPPIRLPRGRHKRSSE